ncbi:MAG: gas vesicle protein GvpO [Hyphomicrobiales bacterium]
MVELRTTTRPRPRPKVTPGARLASGPSLLETPAGEERASARSRPVELISRAKEQLRDLTGYGVDSVSDFAKADGGWHMSVTVVELHRIPAATDVLASYAVDVDEAGDIVSYHRSKRYFRDQVGDET